VRIPRSLFFATGFFFIGTFLSEKMSPPLSGRNPRLKEPNQGEDKKKPDAFVDPPGETTSFNHL
jgi:hypothetical protein